MKRIGSYTGLLVLALMLALFAQAQKDWALVRDGGWIKVYKSNMENSGYKKVKVECTMDGSFDKLLQVLNNVGNHKNWIYSTKNAYIVKKLSAFEYYYYTETALPWPMQNRDAVVHIKVERDPSNRFMKIAAVGVPNYLSCVSGKVRVQRSANTWLVTAPAPGKLHVVYIFEADPGGNLPPWLVNSFVNKGPYESFKKLAELLKK